MDLDASLEFAIEEFRKDVQREFFGHDGDHPAAEVVAKFTRRILALSHSGNVRLTRDATEAGSLPHGSELEGDVDAWRRLPQVIDDLHLREPVISEVQIVLGERYCTRTRAMAHRCLDVVTAVTSAHAKMATTRFLVRAINCYLVGLSAESQVMCRAVLENAVNDKYARAHTTWPTNAEGRHSNEGAYRWSSEAALAHPDAGRSGESGVVARQ